MQCHDNEHLYVLTSFVVIDIFVDSFVDSYSISLSTVVLNSRDW